MDVDASLMLCDANGGNGELKGLIPDLAIQIGGLTTHSNFWVSTECPLDILLGRPWQRHNLVSIDKRLDGTYLRFSHVNGRDNRTLEILVQPQEAKNGNAPLISGRRNATTRSYLGMVVEPEIRDETEMEVRPEHEAQINNIPPPQSVFNTVCTAGEILGGNMPKGSYQLKDAYLSLFQPDPVLQGYGPPLPKLDNSRLGPLVLRVHAPIGNCIANVIIFNSAQYATLQPMLSNMDSDYKIVYILPMQLPEVDAEPSKRRVSTMLHWQ